MKNITLQHYSSNSGNKPLASNLTYGEIAIGYKADNEAIYIKNDNDDIVEFHPTGGGGVIIETTYSKLKSLRDEEKLQPSTWYRITDFVTTVANDNEARSANHPFDVFVFASNVNVLQEEAFVMLHEGDEYFKDNKLESWKIWYCLDNDTTRFQWADSTNGKGVIYRMIDEWNNDCPYDFKNVQFKRYKVNDESDNGELANLDGTYVGYNGEMAGLILQNDSVWAYTFSFGDRQSTPIDASMIGFNNSELGEGYGSKGYYGDNIIKPTTSIVTNDDEINSVFCLNNIVWWTNNIQYRSLINGNRIESECFNMTLSGNGTIIEHDCRCIIMGDGCASNTFGTSCASNTFGTSCILNIFGNRCFNNIFGNSCGGNTFGYDCVGNTFENRCGNNTFGYGCDNNTFGTECRGNIFGNNCNINTFGSRCGGNAFGMSSINNTFGNDCDDNTFGTECSGNTFGDNCEGNTFGNSCYFNTFGNECRSNTFGDNCLYNTFVNYCGSNTFGEGCNYNMFESSCRGNTFEAQCSSNKFGINCSDNTFESNECYMNTFGNDCSENTFGEHCYSNTFGNSCGNNTFGPDCYSNIFGNECSANVFEAHCYSNTFGNSCGDNTFGPGSSSNSVENCFQYNEFLSEGSGNKFGNNCMSNVLENDCNGNTFGNECHNNLFGDGFSFNTLGEFVQNVQVATTSVQNTQVLNGTCGSNQKYLTIDFMPRADYSQFAGLDSEGNLQIWVEADNNKKYYVVTYDKLVELRNNKKLVPSTYYRITDFVTTVANDDDARSANHAFDIFIMATDVDKFQEECIAMLHDGDEYFKDCKLEAWKIWYCLDNDTTRFQWADVTNGKGVIYRMIDEWNNDCPYDFKNIQFKRYKVTDESPNGELARLDGRYYGYNGEINGLTIDEEDYKWVYTFTLINEDDEWIDYSSLKLSTSVEDDLSYFKQLRKGRCEYNVIRHFYGAVSFENVYYQVQSLNNIVLISTMVDNGLSGEILLNTFGVGNYNMTLKNNPEQNHFGDNCYNNIVDSYGNTFENRCANNTFGYNCNNNTFGDDCQYNTFGNSCFSNTFRYSCISNTFKNSCNNNTLGAYCLSNTFGNRCANNTFGYNCQYNIFEDACRDNAFGDDCCSNTFGEDCDSNTFGNYCGSNTFGEDCSMNFFGNQCEHNTIGDSCWNITFRNACNDNKFGFNCGYNAFDSGCHHNTFDNSCSNNTFDNSCSNNTFEQACQYNIFGDKCQYNTFEVKCSYNTFDSDCQHNTFEQECQYNIFGKSCNNIIFGNECYNNTFGINCYHNTFEDYCTYNTFGASCNNNTFGSNYYRNTFGINCDHNTFGNDGCGNAIGNECSNNTFGDCFQYNTLGERIWYVQVPSSIQEAVQYTQILNGTSGNSDNKLVINFVPSVRYSQKAGFDSTNTLRIWVEGDGGDGMINAGTF